MNLWMNLWHQEMTNQGWISSRQSWSTKSSCRFLLIPPQSITINKTQIKPPPSLAAPRTCFSSRNMAGIKTPMLKKQHDKEEKQAAHQASVSSTNSSQFRSSEMTTASDFTTASGQSTSSQASKNSNFHTRNMAVQGYLSGGKWFRIVSWWVVDVGITVFVVRLSLGLSDESVMIVTS